MLAAFADNLYKEFITKGDGFEMRPIHFLQGPQASSEVWLIGIIERIVYPEYPEVREEDSMDGLDRHN